MAHPSSRPARGGREAPNSCRHGEPKAGGSMKVKAKGPGERSVARRGFLSFIQSNFAEHFREARHPMAPSHT